MNMQKISTLILFMILGLFYSCAESSKGVADANNMETEEETIRRALGTWEHLRTAEQKAIFKQVESFVYEGCRFKNSRFEITVNRADMKERGWPEIYYDMMQEDIGPINTFLDTASTEMREMYEQALIENMEEYHARKKSQQAE
jgi:hypothetical protein